MMLNRDGLTVEDVVEKAMLSMNPSPYDGSYLGIEEIRELVKFTHGDKAAKAVKITVH